MARGKATYQPRKKNEKILARGLEIINSVPYRVGMRWLFYRLLQEGYYTRKDDYKNKLDPLLSSARHAFLAGWKPDTLEDATRAPIHRGHGQVSGSDWISSLANKVSCSLAKWHNQPAYIELWYEARAMTAQFEHYTKHIDLRPMGGHASIDYKWQTAKFLEQVSEVYGKPITILYFGDLDNAGGTIAERVVADVRKWCSVDFTFIHCGLTLEQVKHYNVPENFEKPGEYQWEALTDEAAREIITSNVDQFISHDAFSEIVGQQDTATAWLREQLALLASKYKGA